MTPTWLQFLSYSSFILGSGVYIYFFNKILKNSHLFDFFLGAQHRWQLPGSYARGRSRKAGNTKGCQFLMIFLCFPMYLTAWLWLELSTLIFLSVLVTVWLTDWLIWVSVPVCLFGSIVCLYLCLTDCDWLSIMVFTSILFKCIYLFIYFTGPTFEASVCYAW